MTKYSILITALVALLALLLTVWLILRKRNQRLRSAHKQTGDTADTTFKRTPQHAYPEWIRQLPLTWASDVTSAQTLVIERMLYRMVQVQGHPHSGSDSSMPSAPFYISKYPICQREWEAVLGVRPRKEYNDPNCAVDAVSYNDIVDNFLPQLNRLTGLHFRLPTSSEWVFAAHGGNKSEGYTYSGSNNIDEVAWYINNTHGQPAPVGGRKCNELGLYDMSGNVWEWCSDSYLVDGVRHCALHGGDWQSSADQCLITATRYDVPHKQDYGFRLILDVNVIKAN